MIAHLPEPSRVTLRERLAFVDWCREIERLLFVHGLGPLPPQSPFEPAWLKTVRAAMDAKR